MFVTILFTVSLGFGCRWEGLVSNQVEIEVLCGLVHAVVHLLSVLHFLGRQMQHLLVDLVDGSEELFDFSFSFGTWPGLVLPNLGKGQSPHQVDVDLGFEDVFVQLSDDPQIFEHDSRRHIQSLDVIIEAVHEELDNIRRLFPICF